MRRSMRTRSTPTRRAPLLLPLVFPLAPAQDCESARAPLRCADAPLIKSLELDQTFNLIAVDLIAV